MGKYTQSICKACDPRYAKPGKVIKVDEDGCCLSCGLRLSNPPHHTRSASRERWDNYFHDICKTVSSKSPCLSRNIGAILVRDHSIVATGYNGPPRGTPHCGHERFMKDELLSSMLYGNQLQKSVVKTTCPRRILGYKSGTHMELCPAQHAEQNCISNAARLGVSVKDTTLYMNSVIPCGKCFGTLINAGIVEIVIDKAEVYDKHTQFLIDSSSIIMREFKL